MDRNLEEIYRKIYEEENKKAFNEVFKIEEDKPLKLPQNFEEYLQIGIDRIVLKIEYKDLIESTKDLKNIFIQGKYFNFFKTGKVRNHFYCKLDINLPRNIHTSNFKNVRNKKEVVLSIDKALNELKRIGIVVNKSCLLDYIEINKYIVMDRSILELESLFSVVREYLIKGNFSRKIKTFHDSKSKFTGITLGTINKNITFYSKILELLKDQFENIDNKTLRKIARGFNDFIRVELALKKETIKTTYGDKINLEDLLEDPENIIDTIYRNCIEESGLNLKNLDLKVEETARKLAVKVKRFKRIYKIHFVNKFIANYSFKIWGRDQLEEISKNISKDKHERYRLKRSLIKQYSTLETINLDTLDYLKKALKCLDFFYKNGSSN